MQNHSGRGATFVALVGLLIVAASCRQEKASAQGKVEPGHAELASRMDKAGEVASRVALSRRQPLQEPNHVSGEPDPLARLFAGLTPTESELARLRNAEKNPQRHDQLLRALDKKYDRRQLTELGIRQDRINPGAFSQATAVLSASRIPDLLQQAGPTPTPQQQPPVPFTFRRLDVYNSMSGPELSDVHLGILGAARESANDYTVWNPGDTSGTTRVHIGGQMHISFAAEIPKTGNWYLLHPAGTVVIRGHSRVVGHGNSSTCYDAKVRVNYYQVLEVGTQLLEIAGGEIHYDGTRSEDRTRDFSADMELPARYVPFHANQGETLLLTLRIEVGTEANEDGLATGVIDMFGLPANRASDYDTLVYPAP